MYNAQIDISSENGDVLWEYPMYFRPPLGSRGGYTSAAYRSDHQHVAYVASLTPRDALPPCFLAPEEF